MMLTVNYLKMEKLNFGILAAQRLLAFDHGVLSAVSAFGKTVVCSYLIAERKANTLILLQSKELLEQWVDELNKFLIIKHFILWRITWGKIPFAPNIMRYINVN